MTGYIHHLYDRDDLVCRPFGVLHCTACDTAWTPANARGKTTPTEASVEREIREHRAVCPGRQEGEQG